MSGVSKHLLPLLALLASCGKGAPNATKPTTNLLLISLDSVRSDHLSCYGYRPRHAPTRPTTPAIDALAGEGTLFEKARASTSWTLPSHVALLTGHPDLVHGVELDVHRIGDGTPTLAERLSDAGYRTAGFFSGPYLEPRFGFDRGFARYRACYGPELLAASAAYERAHRERLNARDAYALRAAWEREVEAERKLEVASQSDNSSEVVADAVVAELEQVAERGDPFFVFAHFFDPHYDYTPPPPYDRLFDPDYTGSIDGREFYRNPAVAAFDMSSPSERRRTVSDRDLEHLLALYDGELAATDRAVGRVLERLAELGLSDSTLVVLVGDHGDEFFEHDGIGHRRTLFREVLDVPLIVRLPGRVPRGKRIDTPVATYELAAAVLELLGVPASDLERGSIAPLLGGEARAPAPILSRLVTKRPARVGVEIGGRPTQVNVDSIQVQESFLLGSIEILRSRRWILPPPGLDAGIDGALRAEGERRRNEQKLRWIDLERSPSERDEDFEADFSDPDAAAALASYRRMYGRLARLRERTLASAGESGAPPGENAAQHIALGALGYAGGGGTEPPAIESLLLPLPD